MAGKRLEYEITTDPSKGIAGLKQFNSAVKKSMKDVGDSTDDATTNAQKLAKTLSGMADDLEKEMKGAAKAADALGKALGPEITSRVDLDSVVVDLKKMGLSFDEITADADVLATSLRKLDDVRLTGATDNLDKIESSTKRAKSSVDDIGKSAGSSSSALANMVGNSAQDLGSLGGVAGSTGVAIGQMAEYMADAALEGEGMISVLKNFGAVAGPIALVGAAIAVLSSTFADIRKEAEQSKQNVEEFQAALAGAGSDTLAIADRLRQGTEDMDNFLGHATSTMGLVGEFFQREVIGKIPLLGSLFKEEGINVQEVLKKIGTNLFEVAKTTQGNVIQNKKFEQSLLDAKDAGKITGDEYQKLTQWLHGYQLEVKKAKDIQQAFNVSGLEETNAILKDITEQRAPLKAYTDDWNTLIKDVADGKIDTQATADALNRLNTELGITPSDAIGKALDEIDAGKAEEAARATADFADSQNKLAGEIDAVNSALDDQIKALEDQLDAVKSGADMGISLEKAEEGLAAAVQATKDAREAIKKADKPEDRTKAHEEYTKAVEEERDAVIAAGKAQQDYRETQAVAQGVQLSATQKVDGLNDSLEEMAKRAAPEAQKGVYNYLIQLNEIPEDKQTAIYAAVDAGKLDEANALIDEASKSREVALTVDLDTTEALRKLKALQTFITTQFAGVKDLPVLDAGGTAGGFGGVAGERGPEIINSRYLATRPVYIPPGTRVTSRKRTEQILRTRGLRGLKRYDAGGIVPRATNVTINAAVIGSTFDVMNAVNTAVRRAERLLPRHQ